MPSPKRLLLAPCPSHYVGHLATMPSAGFYLIPARVAPVSAIGSYRVRFSLAIHFSGAKVLVNQTLEVSGVVLPGQG